MELAKWFGPPTMPSLVGAVKDSGLYPICKGSDQGILGKCHEQTGSPWLSLVECTSKGKSG